MNKGFTLAELLGVIVILSILSLIAISTIDKNIKEGRVKTCKTQEVNIIEGAKAYSIDNPDFIGNKPINELKDEGYIDADLKNPMTDEDYTKDSSVSISKVGSSYKYNVNYSGEPGCN